MEHFLGEAAEKLGIESITPRDYEFKARLLKQFLTQAHLPRQENPQNTVLINFKNGTFEFNENELGLRAFQREDFLTYQLQFGFDENAACTKWQVFLDEVIPDESRQDVLAEFCGYLSAVF